MRKNRFKKFLYLFLTSFFTVSALTQASAMKNIQINTEISISEISDNTFEITLQKLKEEKNKLNFIFGEDMIEQRYKRIKKLKKIEK